MSMTKQRYRSTLIAAVSGVIILTSTCIIDHLFQEKIKEELSNRLPLVNGSETFSKWSSPPASIYLKFHFFNVSNPDEVLKGKKANLTEIGPFVYKETVTRDIIGWEDDERHLRFKTKKTYHFLPERTILSLDTPVTTINLPLVALISVVLQRSSNLIFSPVIQSVIHGAVKRYNETLFVTRTVREILFDGYQVPLMKAFIEIADKFGIEIPNAPEDGRFGLMLGRNGTDDGEWSINTGKFDLSSLAKIETWNNKSDYSCWGKDGNCNKISGRGTEGSMFPPPILTSSKPEIFCPDLNVTIHAVYKKKHVQDGLTRFRFVLPYSLIAAPMKVEENECYCVKKNPAARERFCSLDGVLDISGCNQGIPAVVSFPHFYMGDYLLTAPFESGIDPQESKHESYFDLEPNSGAVLSAAKRLQLNADLKYINLIEPFKNVKEIIFPSNWIEESFSLTDESELKPLKQLQNVTFYLGLITKILYLISIILIAGAITSVSCFVHQNLNHIKEIISSGESSSLGSYSEVTSKGEEEEADDEDGEHVKITCNQDENGQPNHGSSFCEKYDLNVKESRQF